MFTPKYLKRWSLNGPTAFDSGVNYIGETPTDCYIAPYSITRESADEPMASSNYECQWDVLKDTQARKESFGHWACGWYELVLIPETDEEGLKIADGLARNLDSYPILDEGLFSEKDVECEQQNWDSWARRDFVRELQKVLPEQSDYIDTLTDKQIDTLFWDTANEVAKYPESQGNGDYFFPLVDVAQAITADDLPPWPVYRRGCKDHDKPSFGCDACIELANNKVRLEV
jgi:hypothetical protein